jgi:PAS domain S-box-containing protein
MPTSSRFSVGFRRTIIHVALIVAVMGVFTVTLTTYLSHKLDARSELELARQVSQLVNSMSSYHAALADSANRLSAVFSTQFPGRFSLDHSRNIEIEGHQTPALFNGSTLINNNTASVDSFTGVTGAVASVFVRQGEDFIRVSTSLKKEDGNCAIGTVLARCHPAYTGLLKGEAYVGKVALFGKDYMARYVPVKDEWGNVIAVLFIGLDFTDSLKALKEKIRSTVIGRSGYFYAVDAQEGKDRGLLQIHPFVEGTNVIDEKDTNGRQFIREMLLKKEGVIRYPWMNREAGETEPREKLVAYRYSKELNWVIAAGAPLAELNSEARAVIGPMVGATVMVSIVLILLSVSMVRMERKLTSRMQDSEKRYRELFHSMQSGFALHEIICDAEGVPCNYHFLEVNPAFESMTGLKAKDIIGKTVLEVLPGVETGWIDVYGRVALSGESAHLENYSADLQRYYDVTAYCPQVGSFATIILDVTQRRIAEEALRQKNEEVEQFTYTVSHDMKSPLVTIKTFIGYLEQDILGSDQNRLKQDCDFIRGAAEKMENLLNELLELSRVGVVLKDPVSVEFQELIDDALTAVAGSIADSGVRIRRNTDSITLTGDRPRLGEIWQNLIENAIKYLGDQPDPQIEIGIETRHDERLFFVRDNGMGIDPCNIEKIFGLFEKLDSGSKGSGLGLALVKRIVEVHGGRIWVESQGTGSGSTFYFTLAT